MILLKLPLSLHLCFRRHHRVAIDAGVDGRQCPRYDASGSMLLHADVMVDVRLGEPDVNLTGFVGGGPSSDAIPDYSG